MPTVFGEVLNVTSWEKGVSLVMIMELESDNCLGLEKSFKITKSNHKPNTAKSTTKPCPLVPHLHIF